MKSFSKKLAEYKELIDQDIDQYCSHINTRTLETYGKESQLVSQAYTDILQRGGKRIRGTLTIVGYQMCGGNNMKMIVQAARAVEMMHASILVIDDIQDRAEMRRSGKSTHKLLQANHSEQKWHGDAEHVGISLGLNASLLGSHGAQLVIANLDVSEELKLKAINIMNHTMVVTAHGQTNDIVNEIKDEVYEHEIEAVMQWKTAHYSVLNPIHMGMVLAGAPCEDTNAITEYALNLGKAFQLTDDLLIIDGKDSGKDPIDDIREGKITFLTFYALQNASPKDTKFLRSCMGNTQVTEADFRKCQEIIKASGAAEFARGHADFYIRKSKASLKQHADRWDKESVEFLNGLADYLSNRTA